MTDRESWPTHEQLDVLIDNAHTLRAQEVRRIFGQFPKAVAKIMIRIFDLRVSAKKLAPSPTAL